MGKQRPKAQNMGKYIHIYTPQKTINYENYIKYCYYESNQDKEPFINGEKLKAVIKIFQKIPISTSKKKANLMRLGIERPTKKPDIDNILKVVFDGLNGLAYKDDTQIIELEASKFYSDTPRIELTLIELELNQEPKNLFNI